MMSLTRKQQRFVDAYLECFNAARAAREAGYSVKTCYSIGAENLTKPEVATAIAQRIEATAVTGSEVLARLTEIARGNMGDFLTIDAAGGVHVDLSKSPDKIRLLESVTVAPSGAAKVKMYDAARALEVLGKALGVLSERVTVRDESPVILRVVYDEKGRQENGQAD